MKKLIILILALGSLAVLAFYAMNLSQKKGKSDTELIDFAIKDVSTIDKVIISDPFSRVFELVKNGEEWTDKDGGCITQQNAEFVIDALKNIEFKGYLPDNSHKKFITLMSAQNTKVEIFQNGEWTKTWYIGPASKDHYGQIMLLDSKEYGKSDIPVVMKIKGVHGIIEPRFYADKRKWMCTNIFSIPVNDLAYVEVKFNDEPERSFKVTKNKNKLDVFQQGKPLLVTDTSMIYRYLNNYQKIHYDIPNYELSEKQVDSIKRTIPFCVLTVKELHKKPTKLRCFRIITGAEEIVGAASVADVDKNRFWCELPNGQLVKCQYFVFNPLFLGHIYFPMDLTILKTHDGIVPK